MYDDRNRYTRPRPYTPRESSYQQQSRFRSEATDKSRGGVRGLFGSMKSEKSPASDSSNVVIYSPKTFDDVQALIDYLKRREQVIVDFAGIDQTAVYRIMDFMSGAIYALNGSIQQIAGNIFLFAPSGVTITVPPQFKGRR